MVCSALSSVDKPQVETNKKFISQKEFDMKDGKICETWKTIQKLFEQYKKNPDWLSTYLRPHLIDLRRNVRLHREDATAHNLQDTLPDYFDIEIPKLLSSVDLIIARGAIK